MTRLALSILLAATASLAEVRAPLGAWARPGVPVLLTSDGPVDADAGGWAVRIDGCTAVPAPVLPCAVRVGGEEILRLEPVPAGVRLVGVVGAAPASVASALGPDVRAVAIDPARLAGEHWPALDLFDRIVVGGAARLSEDARAAIVAWVRAGGSLLAVGFPDALAGGTGLGTFRRADSLERLLEDAGPIRNPPVPRTDPVHPEIYDLVRPAAGPDPAATQARWIVTGSVLALLLQLALARLARLERRTLLAGLALVSALGAVLGLLRPPLDYRAEARGLLEVSWRDRGWQRVRVFEVTLGLGPGAAVRPPELAIPCSYRAPGEPWWSDPDRTVAVPAGQQRLFRTDRVERATTPEGESGPGLEARLKRDRDLRALVRAFVPAGWRVLALDGPRAPRAGPGDPPRLLRLEVAPQD